MKFWKLLLQIFSVFFYSFPIQLLVLHIRKNQLILILWLILLGIVNESLGRSIGVPSLFLEPEYLNKVSFWSYLIMGITISTFTMSYHITCYILDAPRFPFLGNLSQPFAKFILNNSIIPIAFMSIYILRLFHFQADNSNINFVMISLKVFALLLGYFSIGLLIFFYFIRTNKDIKRPFQGQVKSSFKRAKVVRKNVVERLNIAKDNKIRVDYYLGKQFKWCQVDTDSQLNSYRILKIFDQNHFNAVIIQISILVLVLAIGTFRDYAAFQIPAGASLVLLFTIILMIAGALAYWLRAWTISFTIILILVLNFIMQKGWLEAKYEAYGLDYQATPAEYSLKTIKDLSTDEYYIKDYKTTLIALENWRKKFPPNVKPKMIFLCVSGGGQRSALWTMRTLQVVDSVLQDDLMKHTILITGASGGLVGAAYYRELFLRKHLGEDIQLYNPEYLENIGKDHLNAIMFSLVVNDLFFGYQTFEYSGKKYIKDRGHAFEEQLNKNTGLLLDKPLCEYREPELLSWIPMMVLAPTIVNDGRKLFISPLNMSYLTVPTIYQTRFLNQKAKGIEFLRFFEKQGASNLRFLTALRMSATFPYVTPNIKLPSEPEMEIMDAGLSDNFGVSNAVRFLFTFKNWISENTSGVIFLSIRDTQKDKPIERSLEQSLFKRIFTPMTMLFFNLEYLQDISNDTEIEFAQSWFAGAIHRIEFQYVPISKSVEEIKEKAEARKKENQPKKNEIKIITIERAALSWRLTSKEKASIKRTVFEFRNQSSLQQLRILLEEAYQ